MNLKTVLLIVLVLFASTAIFFTLGISVQTAYQNGESSDGLQNFVQMCNGTEVEPNRLLDTPGGPT